MPIVSHPPAIVQKASDYTPAKEENPFATIKVGSADASAVVVKKAEIDPRVAEEISLKKGLAEFSAEINADPKNPDAYSHRGEWYSRHGDYKSSIADYSKAIALDPTEPHFYAERGEAELALGNHKSGIIDIVKGAKLYDYMLLHQDEKPSMPGVVSHVFMHGKPAVPGMMLVLEREIVKADAQGDKEASKFLAEQLRDLRMFSGLDPDGPKNEASKTSARGGTALDYALELKHQKKKPPASEPQQ